jgi:cell division protease FtsH
LRYRLDGAFESVFKRAHIWLNPIPGQIMERRTRFNVIYLVFALFAIVLVQQWWQQAQTIEVVPYSEFEKLLTEDRIEEVVVSDSRITGKLKSPEKDGKKVVVANMVQPEVAERLSKFKVKYTRVQESTFLRDVLSWVVPALVFFGVWFWLIRRMAGQQGLGGGFMAIGKSRAKVYVENKTGVTFADVAGVDEAKAELREVVDFLKDPKKYGRLGARVPKGVLLVGPPGTGKTLLARAVAGEAGVPFFSISGSEFVEMFVGVGAARVRDLFEQARGKAPAIIFIDELDALGRARGAYGAGGHDEKEQTLNQLLVELDGFDSSTGLVLLAATNRPEILDPALLRAGRFDRQVLVDRPDRPGRIQILQVHIKKVRLGTDVSIEQIAALTPGFTGADLANLVNEAALLATRRGAEAVAMRDFTEAIERLIAGLEKRNRILNPTERRVVAHHELGHAMVAMALPGTDPVHKVSIIPRGVGALGYTIQRPTEDRFLMTREELENKMAVLLGGRAAEEVVFGHLSTGAADDLAKVTDIARSMVMRYGMVRNLGYVAYEEERAPFLGGPLPQGHREYSEQTAREIDVAVREIVKAAHEKAMGILSRERKLLESWAAKLLEKETLAEAELAELRASIGAAVRAAA